MPSPWPPPANQTNEDVRSELLRGLKSLLEETAAYRARFRTAPADTLLRPPAAQDAAPGHPRSATAPRRDLPAGASQRKIAPLPKL